MRVRFTFLLVILLATGVIIPAQTTASDFFKRGSTRYDQKDYDGAIADYTKVIELNPKESGAYHNRANARSAKDDHDGAIADYTKAIELNGTDPLYYFNRGLTIRNTFKGDYLERAIADFTKVIALDPKHIQALYQRAWTRAGKGDRDGAISDYTKVLQLDPRHINAYYGRGDSRRHKDLDGAVDLAGAIADFTKVIELDPKHVAAHYLRGVDRGRQNDLDGAVVDLTKALKLDPAYVDVYKERADVYLKLGKADLAAADQKKGAEIAEANMDWLGLSVRGNKRFQEMDLDGAIADFTRHIALAPDHSYAYYDRGRARYHKRDFDGAIADATKTLELAPRYLYVYLIRGKSRYAKNELDGAIEDYAMIITLAPERIASLEKEGEARVKNNLPYPDIPVSVAKEFKRLNASAYYYRGLALAAKGSSDLAAADYAKVIEWDPNTWDLDPAWEQLNMNDGARAHRHAAIYLEVNRLKGETASGDAVIVGYLGLRKSGKPLPARAFLNTWLKQVDAKARTTQVLNFFSGKLTAAQLLALAVDNDSLTQARTYIGSIQLLAADRSGAALNFQWVKDNGNKDFTEYTLALAELKRLESTPTKVTPRKRTGK